MNTYYPGALKMLRIFGHPSLSINVRYTYDLLTYALHILCILPTSNKILLSSYLSIFKTS